MQTYSFEVTPWHAHGVKRVLEVPADYTIEQLHLAIQQAFDLDNRQEYAFFLNNEVWDEEFAYGGTDFRSARDTKLGTLSLIPKKRFVYLFDFKEELGFEVRVQHVGVGREGEKYPRVLESVGAAPAQCEEDDEDEQSAHASCHDEQLARPELVTLAYRIKPYIADWDEEVSLEDEELSEEDEGELEGHRAVLRSEARVLEEVAAAMELLEKGNNDPRVIHANVEHTIHMNPWPWLVDLPDRSDEAGHADASITLADRLLSIGPLDPLLFRMPVYLARAGRIDDARKRLKYNLENYPEESRMLLDAGDAFIQLSDDSRAEDCYHSARSFAGQTLPLRRGAMNRLVMLLERQKRYAELEGLLREELAIAEAHERGRASTAV